jgi:hypothetical protein
MIKYIINILIIIVVVYFSISFIEVEIDYTKWDKSDRQVVVIMSIFVSVFVTLIMLMLEND